jgi:hypothetical protein
MDKLEYLEANGIEIELRCDYHSIRVITRPLDHQAQKYIDTHLAELRHLLQKRLVKAELISVSNRYDGDTGEYLTSLLDHFLQNWHKDLDKVIICLKTC